MLFKAIIALMIVHLAAGGKKKNNKKNDDDVTRPNIIFILMDDLGWADVGFTQTEEYHSDTSIYFKTPFLDSLATMQGVQLNRHYVHPTCSPTRAAYLSGRYPFRFSYELFVPIFGTTDLSDADEVATEPLNIESTLLPVLLKKYGDYNTLLSGKWHLGRESWDITPNNYFDEFVSCLTGYIDYYTHRACTRWDQPFWPGLDINESLFNELNEEYPFPDGWCPYDLWNDINSTYDDRSTYNDDVYLEEIYYQTIIDFIDEYGGSKSSSSGDCSKNNKNGKKGSSSDDDSDDNSNSDPFYIQWFTNTPHWPIVDPPSTINGGINVDYSQCSNIVNAGRLSLCKMMQYFDHLVMNLVFHLARNNLWDNTIIIFSSDNGGEPSKTDRNSDQFNWLANGFATNLPFRGIKRSSFEGGIHGPAFISGGYLPSNVYGLSYDNLMGIEDWHSTLLSIADIDTSSIEELDDVVHDSFDHWSNLINLNSNTGGPSDVTAPRDEWIHLQSGSAQATSIITNDGWKYVVYGGYFSGVYDGYYEYDGTISSDTSFDDASEYSQYMLFDIINDISETANLYSSHDNSSYSSIIEQLSLKISEYNQDRIFFGLAPNLDAIKSAAVTDSMTPFSPFFDDTTENIDEIMTLLL